MSDSLRWPDAVLAGLASSMRTSAAPAGLAIHGHITGKPRIAVIAATAGELAGDKAPSAPNRTDPPAVLGRVAAGSYVGREIAGASGAVAGAISAAVGSYATWRIRGLVVDTTGLPDPVIGVGEDVLAISLALIGTRPQPAGAPDAAAPDTVAPGGPTDGEAPEIDPLTSASASASPNGDVAGIVADPDSPKRSILRDAGIGVLVGIGATAAMTVAQGAEFVLTDAEPSSSPSDVADTIKRRAGRGKLKRRHRRVANQGMHWLYGVSWGIPYGIVAARSDVAPEVSGPIFGLLVWGAALAHEPALGIAEVPWKRSLQSLGSEAAFHLVYGIGAGGTLRWLRGAGRGR